VITVTCQRSSRNVRKIFIVDDNLVNRRLLAAILKKEGYELLEAEDGEEAIELAFREMPDLILLDIMMPKRMATRFVQNSKTMAGRLIYLSYFSLPRRKRKIK